MPPYETSDATFSSSIRRRVAGFRTGGRGGTPVADNLEQSIVRAFASAVTVRSAW